MNMPRGISIAICLLTLTSCSFDFRPFHGGCSTARGRTVYALDYGYRKGGTVVFVVIQSGTPTYQQRANISVTSEKRCEGWVTLPDGTRKDLLWAGKIYDFSGGKFASEPIFFNRDQLEKFLESEPEEYSISELKKFLKKDRT